jgi:hypothetical protein
VPSVFITVVNAALREVRNRGDDCDVMPPSNPIDGALENAGSRGVRLGWKVIAKEKYVKAHGFLAERIKHLHKIKAKSMASKE